MWESNARPLGRMKEILGEKLKWGYEGSNPHPLGQEGEKLKKIK